MFDTFLPSADKRGSLFFGENVKTHHARGGTYKESTMNPPEEIVYLGEKVVVHNHAVERMIERWKIRHNVDLDRQEAHKKIRKLFKNAEPEEIKAEHKLYRLLNNGIKPATYLSSGEWRLVLVRVGQQLVLKTVEMRDCTLRRPFADD